MRVRAGAQERAIGCLLAGLLLAAPACSGDPDDGGRPIEPAELASRIEAGDAPLVLDVRTPEEFEAGHIPGAVNVPIAELEARLAELERYRSEEVVVHCQSGRRAAAAEEILLEAGFTDVRDLSGHMAGWQQGGHPVE